MEQEFKDWMNNVSTNYTFNDLRVGSKLRIIQGGLKGCTGKIIAQHGETFTGTFKGNSEKFDSIVDKSLFPKWLEIIEL